MTDSRAPADPYRWSFEATVESVDDRHVVLDRTYFYAEGGGQPADRGSIAGTTVTDVRKRSEEVVHELAERPPFEVGDTVAALVDPAFRTYCMRAHTASHALYGAGRRVLDDLGYGGFDITPEKVRVDFTTTTDIDDDVLVELERLLNRVVWESRDVTWETHPRDEALSMDEIAFNTKTEEGIESETIRVVTIEGDSELDADVGEGAAGQGVTDGTPWDVAACGGTHVSTTREIGPVTVLDRSNPGEGMTRVEMAIGPPAIERRATEKRALLDSARDLSVPPEDLSGAIDRMAERVDDLESEVASLQDRLVEIQIQELRDDPIERDGSRWVVGAFDGADANTLGDHAKTLAGGAADVIALAGEDGRTFLVVAAEDGDASSIVADVTDAFGGGGGGSPQFAQAGGIDADPAEIVAFLRDA